MAPEKVCIEQGPCCIARGSTHTCPEERLRHTCNNSYSTVAYTHVHGCLQSNCVIWEDGRRRCIMMGWHGYYMQQTKPQTNPPFCTNSGIQQAAINNAVKTRRRPRRMKEEAASMQLSVSHTIQVSEAGEREEKAAEKRASKTHTTELEAAASYNDLIDAIDSLQEDASRFLTECITKAR